MSLTGLLQKVVGLAAPSSQLPMQWRHQKLSTMPLLAIDLELTSLDCKTAKIASVGWVEGIAQSTKLASSFHQVVRVAGDLAQSPTIHGITAEDLAKGCHVKDVLTRLASFASSHVWVFHNTQLDIKVLHRVMTLNHIHIEQVVTIDTMKLAMYELGKHQAVLKADSVTLSNARLWHGLPRSPAHNALDDAFSTLQLWFAQQYMLDKVGESRLCDISHTKCVGVHSLGVEE